MNLLVVGSVAFDTIETPFGKHERLLGGAATYASIAASFFSDPGIVGVVGRDFEPAYLELLEKRGIDLDGLQVDESGDTFHWSGYYEGDMNQAHTRDTRLNVFEKFSPTLPDSYRKAKFVLLGNIAPALQLEVLSQARDCRLALCDTMNFWISSAPEELEKVFRKVHVICINDGEVCQFCNQTSVPVAARELLKLGPERVIVKKGTHGALIFGKDAFFALPALPLTKVKDPTGAGDSFAGGFMGAVARSGRLSDNGFRRGLMAGTAMASYCVEDFSCRRLTRLKTKDIVARIRMLKDATRLPPFRLD